MTNLKPLRLHSTSSLSPPIDVTLTSTKLCGPSGAGFRGGGGERRPRASVPSYNGETQSKFLVIRCLRKCRGGCASGPPPPREGGDQDRKSRGGVSGSPP